MTAASPNPAAQWRLFLAVGLVAVNLLLIALNLAKHDLVTLSFGSSDETEAVVGGATTDAGIDPTSSTVALIPADDGTEETTGGEATAATDVDAEAPASTTTSSSVPTTIDDWPGGRGPEPDGPAEARLAVVGIDGNMQLTGSAPDWATVTKIVQYAGEKLPGGPDAVDNQLTWHPDASPSTRWGDVVMPEATTFDVGSAELDPAAIAGLDVAAEILTSNPSVFAIVIGHADNRGDDTINAELAAQRAGVVVDYLVTQGVVPGQIVVASAGEDDPAASNATEEGRALNRRTEIQFKNLLIPEGRR